MLGHHLAQFTGQIPTYAQLLEETAHGIERTAFVEGPVTLIRFASQLGGHALAILVHASIGHAKGSAGSLFPFALILARDAVAVSFCPGFSGNEIGVIPQKRQPVRSRNQSVSPMLQSFGRELERPRAGAFAHEQFYQARPGRLRHDGQFGPGHLLDVHLQVPRRKTRRARRVIREHNLGAGLAVLHNKRRGSGN